MYDILNIAHIALWTRDLESAAAFWRRYFDARVGEPYYSKRRPGFVSRFVSLPGGIARIELMTGPWIAEPSTTDQVGWDHVAVALGSTKAVDELAARCKADGVLVSAPRTTGDGYYEAVVALPHGTQIEITT
jgi:lactoylglutathione lyase